FKIAGLQYDLNIRPGDRSVSIKEQHQVRAPMDYTKILGVMDERTSRYVTGAGYSYMSALGFVDRFEEGFALNGDYEGDYYSQWPNVEFLTLGRREQGSGYLYSPAELALGYNLTYGQDDGQGYSNDWFSNYDYVRMTQHYADYDYTDSRAQNAYVYDSATKQYVIAPSYGSGMSQMGGNGMSYPFTNDQYFKDNYSDLTYQGNSDLFFSTPNSYSWGYRTGLDQDRTQLATRNYYNPTTQTVIYQSNISRVMSPDYNNDYGFYLDDGFKILTDFNVDQNRRQGFTIVTSDRKLKDFDLVKDPVTGDYKLVELHLYELSSADQGFIYRAVDKDQNVYQGLYDSKAYLNASNVPEKMIMSVSGRDIADFPTKSVYSINSIVKNNLFEYDKDSQTFEVDGQVYRIFHNPNTDTYLVERQGNYEQSVSVPKVVKIGTNVYRVTKETDPLSISRPDGDKFYFRFEKPGSDQPLRSSYNHATQKWEVKLADDKVYELGLEDLTGEIVFTVSSERSRFSSLFNSQNCHGSEEPIKYVETPKSDAADNEIYYKVAILTTNFSITENNQTRIVKVVTKSDVQPMKNEDKPDPIRPVPVNSVTLQRVVNGNLEDKHFDIFKYDYSVEEVVNGRRVTIPKTRFYVAYESSEGVYETKEVSLSGTVFLDGFEYRVFVNRDPQTDEIKEVSLDRITYSYSSSKGVELGGKLYAVSGNKGSYKVTVGEDKRHYIYTTDSNGNQIATLYLPDEYESNPYDNTVILDNGVPYQIVIDPNDPQKASLMQRYVDSYQLPSVKLGDRYFTVTVKPDGTHLIMEAYQAKPKRYLGVKDAYGAETVNIDGSLYSVTLGADQKPMLTKLNVSLPRSTADQAIELDGKAYRVEYFADDDKYFLKDIYDPQVAYLFKIDPASGTGTFTLKNLAYEAIKTQDGTISVVGIGKTHSIERSETVIDGKYYQITYVNENWGSQGGIRTYTFSDLKNNFVSERAVTRYAENAPVNVSAKSTLTYKARITIADKDYYLVNEDNDPLKIRLEEVVKESQAARLIQVGTKTYSVKNEPASNDGSKISFKETASSPVSVAYAGNIKSNVYAFSDGETTYYTNPATQIIRLGDGKTYSVKVSDETGQITLEEMNGQSLQVQTLEVDGRLYTVTVDPNDPLHSYKFNDGYGEYTSVKDTFGFYSDRNTIYSNQSIAEVSGGGTGTGAFTATESRENFENYSKDDMFGSENQKYTRNEMNYKFDIKKDGTYDIGLFAKTYKDLKSPLRNRMGADNRYADEPPADVYYDFKVYVDGLYKGTFSVLTDGTDFKRGFLPLDLRTGQHDIKISWDLPKLYDSTGSDVMFGFEQTDQTYKEIFGDLSLSVKDIFVADPDIVTADLDGDLKITTVDMDILKANRDRQPKTSLVRQNAGLSVADDFSSPSGWSDNRVSVIGEQNILGGYGKFGTGSTLTKTFTETQGGFATISFDYYFIDTWDQYEEAYLEVNGNRVWAASPSGDGGNFTGAASGDHRQHVEINIPVTAGELKLKFSTNLNEGAWNESWAIGSFSINHSKKAVWLDHKLYDYIQNEDKTAWIFWDGKESQTSTADQRVKLGDAYYHVSVFEDTAGDQTVKLTETADDSVKLADAIIEAGGLEYKVTKNRDGSFNFDDGKKVVTASAVGGRVVLNGTLYNLIPAKDPKNLVLQEIVLESKAVATSKMMKVGDKFYGIEKIYLPELQQYTYRFYYGPTDGNDYRDMDLATKTVLLDGKNYLVSENEDGDLSLIEARADILSSSRQKITVNQKDYLVVDNGNGTFTFGSEYETQTSDQNHVVRIAGEDYYLFQNRSTGFVTLIKEMPVRSTSEGGSMVTLSKLELPEKKITEDFDSGASGWSDNSATSFWENNASVEVLGGYQEFGIGKTVSKTFESMPGDEITISFDYYFINNWSNENAYLDVNGVRVWSRQGNFSGDYSYDSGGYASFRSLKEHIEIKVPAVATGNITLNFSTDLKEIQGDADKWWALDNLQILNPSLITQTTYGVSDVEGKTGIYSFSDGQNPPVESTADRTIKLGNIWYDISIENGKKVLTEKPIVSTPVAGYAVAAQAAGGAKVSKIYTITEQLQADQQTVYLFSDGEETIPSQADGTVKLGDLIYEITKVNGTIVMGIRTRVSQVVAGALSVRMNGQIYEVRKVDGRYEFSDGVHDPVLAGSDMLIHLAGKDYRVEEDGDGNLTVSEMVRTQAAAAANWIKVGNAYFLVRDSENEGFYLLDAGVPPAQEVQPGGVISVDGFDYKIFETYTQDFNIQSQKQVLGASIAGQFISLLGDILAVTENNGLFTFNDGTADIGSGRIGDSFVWPAKGKTLTVKGASLADIRLESVSVASSACTGGAPFLGARGWVRQGSITVNSQPLAWTARFAAGTNVMSALSIGSYTATKNTTTGIWTVQIPAGGPVYTVSGDPVLGPVSDTFQLTQSAASASLAKPVVKYSNNLFAVSGASGAYSLDDLSGTVVTFDPQNKNTSLFPGKIYRLSGPDSTHLKLEGPVSDAALISDGIITFNGKKVAVSYDKDTSEYTLDDGVSTPVKVKAGVPVTLSDGITYDVFGTGQATVRIEPLTDALSQNINDRVLTIENSLLSVRFDTGSGNYIFNDGTEDVGAGKQGDTFVYPASNGMTYKIQGTTLSDIGLDASRVVTSGGGIIDSNYYSKYGNWTALNGESGWEWNYNYNAGYGDPTLWIGFGQPGSPDAKGGSAVKNTSNQWTWTYDNKTYVIVGDPDTITEGNIDLRLLAESSAVSKPVIRYNGDLYTIETTSTGNFSAVNGVTSINFDRDGQANINGLFYRLTGADISQKTIEGPFSAIPSVNITDRIVSTVDHEKVTVTYSTQNGIYAFSNGFETIGGGPMGGTFTYRGDEYKITGTSLPDAGLQIKTITSVGGGITDNNYGYKQGLWVTVNGQPGWKWWYSYGYGPESLSIGTDMMNAAYAVKDTVTGKWTLTRDGEVYEIVGDPAMLYEGNIHLKLTVSSAPVTGQPIVNFDSDLYTVSLMNGLYSISNGQSAIGFDADLKATYKGYTYVISGPDINHMTIQGPFVASTRVADSQVIVNQYSYFVTFDYVNNWFEFRNNSQSFHTDASGVVDFGNGEIYKAQFDTDGKVLLVKYLTSDLNKDGFVNSTDENLIAIALGSGIFNAAADLDKNGRVDWADLDIFSMQRDHTALWTKMNLDSTDYHVMQRDGIYRFYDRAKPDEPVDANETNSRIFLKGVEYIMNSDQGELNLSEERIGDLNKDGQVNGLDKDIFDRSMWSSYVPPKNGSEFSATSRSSSYGYWYDDFARDGTTASTSVWTMDGRERYLDYEFNVGIDGNFDIALHAKAGQTGFAEEGGGSIPEGYKYQF
ncbi:MAG: hypothetical protein COT00_00180, partial [Candidatus Omnitrophica bacterium CG07_land_8_20_14_0_80_50_8]